MQVLLPITMLELLEVQYCDTMSTGALLTLGKALAHVAFG